MTDLEKIGNVGEYSNNRRIIQPIGMITSPDLVLKYYGMFGEGESFKKEHADNYEKIIKNEIEKKNIDPQSGLGFVILSFDMANVAVWDKKSPIILKNKIYVDGEKGVEVLNLNKEGAFCAWEIAIVNYERNLWLDYLKSKRKDADKRKYLDTRLDGLL